MTNRHAPDRGSGPDAPGPERGPGAGPRVPGPAEARLYLIADPSDARSCGADLGRLRAALRGGVDWLQIRMKSATTAERRAACDRLRPILQASGVALIVNDDVAAAVAVGADGVHVGQADLPIEEVRSWVGEAMWVGVSTHSAEQAVRAAERGADLVGIGAMFPTTTKDAALRIGPDVLAELSDGVLDARCSARARARGPFPVFPIGGIGPGNVSELVRRGVRRAAVSSAVLAADDPEAAARALRRALLAEG